ncbi:MAG: hypothetical protein J4431_03520 [Candidatus Aenigmarchaeota archaeon]|nr:hypothetical protein [Candidatus Aenigmarchaeota archaeon]
MAHLWERPEYPEGAVFVIDYYGDDDEIVEGRWPPFSIHAGPTLSRDFEHELTAANLFRVYQLRFSGVFQRDEALRDYVKNCANGSPLHIDTYQGGRWPGRKWLDVIAYTDRAGTDKILGAFPGASVTDTRTYSRDAARPAQFQDGT